MTDDLLRALIIDASDNVATAMADLKGGTEVAVESGREKRTMTIVDSIDFGHKFALIDIKQGDEIRKYGAPIGIATTDISPGVHVHMHNIESQRGRGDLA